MSRGRSRRDSRRWVLEYRDGGGFVRLDRDYYPPDVRRVDDPLDADRYYSRKDAFHTIDGVFKEDSKNYRACRLLVEVVRQGVPRA